MKGLLISAVIALSGCAAHSGVIQMGPNSYFVSRQAATGFTGMGTLKGQAMAEAGAFCTAKGKTAEVVSEQDANPPYILGNFPKTEIKFRCV